MTKSHEISRLFSSSSLFLFGFFCPVGFMFVYLLVSSVFVCLFVFLTDVHLNCSFVVFYFNTYLSR